MNLHKLEHYDLNLVDKAWIQKNQKVLYNRPKEQVPLQFQTLKSKLSEISSPQRLRHPLPHIADPKKFLKSKERRNQ